MCLSCHSCSPDGRLWILPLNLPTIKLMGWGAAGYCYRPVIDRLCSRSATMETTLAGRYQIIKHLGGEVSAKRFWRMIYTFLAIPCVWSSNSSPVSAILPIWKPLNASSTRKRKPFIDWDPIIRFPGCWLTLSKIKSFIWLKNILMAFP